MSRHFWEITTKFPVTKTLAEIFAPKNLKLVVNRPTYRTHSNVDIVSPALCKDAIEQIRHDFQGYSGCDIIDINPGCGIWSQHIHAFLKPRHHLLLEPDDRYVEPFLRPLLNQPDSTYRYSPLKPTHHGQYWSTYKQVFDNELLPKRDPLPENDPRLREPNKTLLLTGNILRLHRQVGVKPDVLANTRLILTHLIQSSQTNSLLHSYGLVRMLLWAPRELETSILPWSVNQRSGRGMVLELGADTTQVVAAPEADDLVFMEKTQPRPDSFTAVATLQALQGMKEAKMALPPENRLVAAQMRVIRDLHDVGRIAERIDMTKDFNAVLSHGKYFEKLQSLEKDVKKFKNSVFRGKRSRLVMNGASQDPTATTIKFLDNDIYDPFEIDRKNLFTEFMQLSARQITLEAQYLGSAPVWSLDESKDVEQRLLATTEAIRTGLRGPGTSAWLMWATRYTNIFNEQLAVTRKPVVLASNRRPYLPIRSQPDEFWPNIPSMLLDIKPKRSNFASDIINKSHAADVSRAFVRGIYQWRGETLQAAIDHLTMDASEDIYAAVPDLKDPRKGGRLDPKDLFLKGLCNELLEKVVHAYLEWPFRPQDSSALTAGIGSEDAGGDEDGTEADDEISDDLAEDRHDL